MRTIHLAAFVVGALALSAGTTAAQTSPILNILDLQKLVAAETPAANARLAAHFTALADQSTLEAKRHQAMSTGFGSNPSRQFGTSMTAHCNKLAGLNQQAAATLRDLAAHHTKLASGAPSIAVPNAEAYQSGKGARVPTDNELKVLATKASTAADHHALMEYFNEASKRYAAAAADHERMSQSYRGTRIASAAVHCDRMVTLSRDAAKEASAAATMHKDLAGIGR